ncbi:Predicted arabinose efflux permease, MFS family [Hymenobacter gelipurpurascens]|uniref:Predicted arabinose efflux permease, MFS family n=1 Tax=Hymenobacter gelipurpurascens TaxID=89968 RepID=A0A212T5I1_9BACT|nr:MFS transporter [Hymenobacter gelipurpurascens]SNC61288.1 Predicted arabinose efflux permease, MFS family [Hymenobacter gelipurpurascens]
MSVPVTAPSPPPASTSPFTPLRIPFFRMLWIASFVSNIGTWMQNVGAVGLMTQLTPSPALVALLQTASALPVFLLSLPAGALADLVDRRKMLLLTQTWMAGTALVLATVTLLGLTTPWLLLLLTFMLGLGGALNNPVWQTVTPELVPRAELPQAIALNSVSFNLARAFGPALGGLVIGYFSSGAAFLLNGISFVATMYMVWSWKRAPQTTSPLAGERIIAAIRGGIRYARFAPPVQHILVRGVSFTFGASALFALMPAVVTQRLQEPTSFYSMLLSCMGIGAVIGAVILPRLNRRLTIDMRVTLATVAFASGLAGLAYANNHWLLYALLTLVGLAWMLVLNSFSVGVQTVVPRWVQARTISLYLLTIQGGMALGSVVWGTVAERVGVAPALAGATGWLLLSTLLVFRFSLRTGENLDFTPARPRNEPVLALAPVPSEGPVIITTIYRVAPQDRPAFMAIMDQLARIRRREGAIRVGTYVDLADPTRLVEYFMVESWEEHAQQHERGVSQDEELLKTQARQLHQGPEPPLVSHLLALHDAPVPTEPVMVPGSTRLVASTAGEATA